MKMTRMRMNSEFRFRRRELGEPAPQSLVDNGLEWTAGFAGEIRQALGEIGFQS
jgi:hypothetical protein